MLSAGPRTPYAIEQTPFPKQTLLNMQSPVPTEYLHAGSRDGRFEQKTNLTQINLEKDLGRKDFYREKISLPNIESKLASQKSDWREKRNR